jgi:aspartate/methionine/tyrosine aminotransferase
MDVTTLLSDRARGIDASGIRRVFELGAGLKDPINLSIGQPDFPVPAALKRAAIEAIESDQNGYTLTQGTPSLRARIARHLAEDVGWSCATGAGRDGPGLMVTSGTSGALLLSFLSLLSPGDEVVIPDPYFVAYPSLATMCGARAVLCDTYPDFRMTPERVAPLLTARTKAVLFCSPSNPCGVALRAEECRGLLDLCRDRGIVLISDEIYDEFAFSGARTQASAGDASVMKCPSPARFGGSAGTVLLIRGLGKTYGCTGWRLGYAAGPAPLINAMTRMQQYSFVCAPSPLQSGAEAAFDVDMGPTVRAFERRRDLVVDRLSRVTEVATPDGAFYAFVKVPERLGLTGSQFFEKCVERSVLVIPGGVFSGRDTHFRLSFATPEDRLERGLEILAGLMG